LLIDKEHGVETWGGGGGRIDVSRCHVISICSNQQWAWAMGMTWHTWCTPRPSALARSPAPRDVSVLGCAVCSRCEGSTTQSECEYLEYQAAAPAPCRCRRSRRAAAAAAAARAAAGPGRGCDCFRGPCAVFCYAQSSYNLIPRGREGGLQKSSSDQPLLRSPGPFCLCILY
jgi:hypothetical protein